jgi:hypothetical protein
VDHLLGIHGGGGRQEETWFLFLVANRFIAGMGKVVSLKAGTRSGLFRAA